MRARPSPIPALRAMHPKDRPLHRGAMERIRGEVRPFFRSKENLRERAAQ
jgi:hypothetical protein